MKSLIVQLIIIVLLGGCNKQSVKTSNNKESIPPHLPAPTTIKENKSIVKVKIIKIIKDEKTISLKAKILKVYEENGYPSVAVVGEDVLLKPNFAVDSKGNLLESSKNKGLLKLRKFNKGDIIKLEVFFERGNNWFINKLLEQQ